MIKTGPNDLQPQEPIEVPEAIVEISMANISEKDLFTAEELNNRIEWFVEYAHQAELDCPIYLNGIAWEGHSFEDKDMV